MTSPSQSLKGRAHKVAGEVINCLQPWREGSFLIREGSEAYGAAAP